MINKLNKSFFSRKPQLLRLFISFIFIIILNSLYGDSYGWKAIKFKRYKQKKIAKIPESKNFYYYNNYPKKLVLKTKGNAYLKLKTIRKSKKKHISLKLIVNGKIKNFCLFPKNKIGSYYFYDDILLSLKTGTNIITIISLDKRVYFRAFKKKF